MPENAFTPAQGVPARLSAGDFWTWRADIFAGAYPGTDYGLTYSLAPRQGGTATDLAASWDGDGWLVSASGATTASLAPGSYAWSLLVTRTTDSAQVTICTGTTEVLAAAGADQRSYARRLLEAIEARLEGRATKDVDAYSIEGRSLTRIPFAELRATRARLLREVAAEDRAARGQAGMITYSRAR